MRAPASLRFGAVALLLGVTAAACGSDDSGDDADATTAAPATTAADATTAAPDTTAGGPATSAPAAGASLAGVCPDTVAIQLDWEPESEHGGLYQLLGDEYDIDAAAKKVSGPLIAGGVDTGVDVEIRIGGASVGYQPVQSLLYQDTSLLLGYVRVSETMASQADTPVVSVMSTMDKSPFAIYWDPETYPNAETIADLKTDDVTILMGGEANVWQDYLVAEGLIDEGQIDRSDAPKPASFVAAAGKLAEAGFASAEPYMYEFEVPEWGKPVKLQLIHDTGYPEYFQALAVREEAVAEETDCLAALVPILQQAEVDYVADPAETNALIVELVGAYDTGWIYTPGNAEWSIEQQIALGIVGNGEDSTLGEFDEARVQTLLDITGEVSDVDVSAYTPADFVTNEFIDPSIGLS